MFQTVGLYDDSVILKKVWRLQLERNVRKPHNIELEFIKDLIFEHEPTEEEILHAMSANGLTRFDFAFVQKGYLLDVD